MSIEIQYQVFSASTPTTQSSSRQSDDIIFESTVWLPNSKVPLKVLQTVIERQIEAFLNRDSETQKQKNKKTSVVLYFKNVPIDLSKPINSLQIGNDEKIVVCFVCDGLQTTNLKSWGYGMACASSNNPSKDVSSKFGAVEGIPVGTWWRYRSQASQCNVHAPLVASLHGKHDVGVYSLIFSGQYPEDVDLGDRLFFSGTGARKTATGKRIPETKLKTNQTLTGLNKALAMNCAAAFVPEQSASAGPNWRDGRPIRVLRNGNGRIKTSKYLPQIGVRYDGLYKVVKYWPEVSDNHRLWKFLLQRDDPQPSPWSEKGRYQRRKLGLESPIYPLKWCKSIAGQRQSKTDSKMAVKSRQQTRVPDDIVRLIEQSDMPVKAELLKFKNSKKSFEKAAKERLKCLFCSRYPPQESIGFKQCYHNFCKQCLLSRKEYDSFHKCSTCRKFLIELLTGDKTTIPVNSSHESLEDKPIVYKINERLKE